MSAEEVLHAFYRDAPYLFLGAAFTAVGIVSAAFAALRRRRDSLVIFFALFAALYGLRLWISSPLLAMTVPSSTIYPRVRAGFSYTILIPAFLFFISLGLPRRIERVVAYATVGLGCILASAAFLFGDSIVYERTNSFAVISASTFFLIHFMADSCSGRSLAVLVRDEFGFVGQHAKPICHSSVCPPELRIGRTAILRCGPPASLARKEWTRDSN